jgi:hypothetical protein
MDILGAPKFSALNLVHYNNKNASLFITDAFIGF